ncbi:ATP-binding protein [Geobacter sp. DSM 9736]|uniref:PAS domain-containing sensor histidine kinase n=1 Tax=Geobacter sp. DSM 9736 TaxID=1277350 RepID=UPI000B514B59|nr:ATP-binding protein [Geobacter sp. DSM 9736]SNB46120.1 PAS domain S-box-containing protein [Geobacter sp. DSM 9736]
MTLRIVHLHRNPAATELVRHELEVADLKAEVAGVADYAASFRSADADLVLADFDPSVGQPKAVNCPLILLCDEIGVEDAVAAVKKGATDIVSYRNLARLAPAIREAMQEASAGNEALVRAEEEVRRRVEVTERKRAEDSLRESEQLLRFVAESSPDAIFIQDLELRYIWVGKAIPPLRREELLGKTDWDYLSHDDAQYLTELKRRVLQSEEQVGVDITLTLGVERVFEAAYTPWRNKEGRVIGIAGYVHEITEKSRAEIELERQVNVRTAELAKTVHALQGEVAERQLAEEALKAEMERRMEAVDDLREKERLLLQQSRQAAMGEMIGNIAHQWRQPLNTLGLLVQGLPMHLEFGELTRDTLQAMVEKSMQLINHMSRTIDDFRNFFKPNKEMQQFSVCPVVEKTISLLYESLRNQGIRIEYSSRGNPGIQGFPNEFSQVLINILNNARDALVERSPENPQISVTVAEEEGSAVVTIVDNAGGVPPEIMDRIFEPYFTTKGAEKGTGVGLFMSKTIIEKNMNGRLTVRNTPDGAEFRIII